MKLKLDIENKILIPFMILAILPITILGIVSYWNGYQLLVHDRTNSQHQLLTEVVAFLALEDEKVQSHEISQEEAMNTAIAYFQSIGRDNLAIIDQEGLVVGDEDWISESSIERIRTNPDNMLDLKSKRYLYEEFSPWNWTVIVGISKSFFPEELISIQKYALLLTIIFLVLSMQSIIFIAHHISKPIKYFAEVCKKIELGHLNEKVNINRSDEIGVLAGSFNHMIDQINMSTEKLIEMTKFHEDILKNIDIGIMTTDNNGLLLSINQSGKDIIKRHEDAALMQELEMATIRTIERKKNENKVISVKTEKGKTIYMDLSTSLLKKEDGSYYGAICSFNDITERKVLENNLVRMDRLASVGQFAAGLAHEIRNPLTGIKTGIQVIKNREKTRGEVENSELMEGLTYEIDRINSLVTDLLDFSKPKQTMQEKENIMEVIRKVLELAKKEIFTKEITVEVRPEGSPLYVFADKGQIEQIFLNIVTNGIEAMEPKGTLLIRIASIVKNGRQMIQTEFIDDGQGIEEEHLDKIFNPFFTTKAKGTGLGLVVVAKLIEENKGKISIDSKVNQGTKITILLPEYRREHGEAQSTDY